MIRLINNRLAAFKHVIFDNPLFLYRLRQFSIYTWFNLATFFTLLMVLYFNAARLAHYREAHRAYAAISLSPPVTWAFTAVNQNQKLRFESSPKQTRFESNPSHTGYDFQAEYFDTQSFSSFPRFSELFCYRSQLLGIGLLYLLLLCDMGKTLLGQKKKKWDHPYSTHIRLLPVTRSQVQFALIDLRFFVISLCILFGTLLLLLPSLKLESSYVWRQVFVWEMQIWIITFAIYRIVQIQLLCKFKFRHNPLIFWSAFIFLFPFVIPLVLFKPIQLILGLELYLVWGPLVYYTYYAAYGLLLIACWKEKRLLLVYHPPE